ncbi:MAG: LysM peptidoglycan-binding domain-containing protein [Candidatus Omnitrophica bacterium]|nr:LysM peptidoglycan-binding domain-containing protein [Candidatus Omnitrophota bacterium]MCM8802768.1 LysM peptidoglycan-binding domain-containing protein [Candidatus Omnitrophota bacterium]
MITKKFIIFIAFLCLNLYSNIVTVYHTVKKGENLYTIARKYGKTTDELKKLNNLKSITIYPGQKIIVDKKEKQPVVETKTNLEKQYYNVQKGDNLYKISKKFGVSIAQLKKMNNLKSSTIHPGQKIIVGYKKIENEKSVKKEINPDEIQSIVNVSKKIYYKISEGDTIESISEKFGIEPDKLLQANLIRKEDLKVGQIIVIPPKEILEEETKIETTIENKSNIRIKLIEEVFNYLGSRYVYGGESKTGLDCSGLTRLAYKTIGILLPQNSSLQYKNGIEIKKEEALPGDLVFFKRGGRIGHVGIYLGNDLFIHASYTLKRVVISSLSERYFKERFAGFRRYLVDEEAYFAKGIENVEQE